MFRKYCAVYKEQSIKSGLKLKRQLKRYYSNVVAITKKAGMAILIYKEEFTA